MPDTEMVNAKRRPKRKTRSTSVSSSAAKQYKRAITVFKADDELKFWDPSLTITPLAATWVQNTTLVGGITRGTDADERVGRKIAVHSLHIRMSWQLGANVGPIYPTQALRLVAVYDKQPNGAAPANTAIFVTDNVNSHKNLTNEARFQILFDRTFTHLRGPGEVDYDIINIYKKFTKPLVVEYSGNLGTVADITTGNIILMAAVTNGTAASASTVTGYGRIRFRG